jgi:CTP synthase
VPVLGTVGEQKTKPTQHGIRELRSAGLSPDFIVCRSEQEILKEVRQKIAYFTHVDPECVISAHNVADIHEVPGLLAE